MPSPISQFLSSHRPNPKPLPTQQDAAHAFTQYLHALEPVLVHVARPVVASGALDHAADTSGASHFASPGVLLIGQELDLGKATARSGRIGGTALVVWPDRGFQRIRYCGAWCLQGGRHYQRDWKSQLEPITALDAVEEWGAAELLRSAAGALLAGIQAPGCPEDARHEAIRRAYELPSVIDFEHPRPARRRR